ncbi:MAG: type II toxin-antitoxin system RelE/ParE family toxin [Lentisphaerae bacterium]|nr:type II toxin-antitoxin system RelE/ParE family toxin [Lentisphaerota bacterium]
MKVHWTNTAEDHLDAIYAYIAKDSPEYAQRMVDRLTHRSQQIADFPLSGRRVPEYETDQIREVIEGPYRIIYHLKPDQIDVLAVLHGAQDVLRRDQEAEPRAELGKK